MDRKAEKRRRDDTDPEPDNHTGTDQNVPLSKRIRGLQIDSCTGLDISQTASNSQAPATNGLVANHNNIPNGTPSFDSNAPRLPATVAGFPHCDAQHSSDAAAGNNAGLPDYYDPELDERLNPEYFQINSILFRAHTLRMQRYGLSSFQYPPHTDNNGTDTGGSGQ